MIIHLCKSLYGRYPSVCFVAQASMLIYVFWILLSFVSHKLCFRSLYIYVKVFEKCITKSLREPKSRTQIIPTCSHSPVIPMAVVRWSPHSSNSVLTAGWCSVNTIGPIRQILQGLSKIFCTFTEESWYMVERIEYLYETLWIIFDCNNLSCQCCLPAHR